MTRGYIKNWQSFSIVWLIVVCSLAFLWNLGNVGLVDETEPLFAEAAREMTVTGNWITPYFNGETRFDKPPLVYWLMAIGYHLIGVNEWSVRLPSAIAAICLTTLLFFTLKHFAVDLQGNSLKWWFTPCLGAALAAFNMHTLIWSRTGVSDMLLSGCIGCSLLCFYWGYVQGERDNQEYNWHSFPNRWYLAFYILLGCGVLTKGPVGIVLPGIIILGFLLYLGKFKQVCKEIGLLWGAVIFTAVTIPWYILVTLENGDKFINSFFGYHNFERFTSVVNHHAGPWYFYFLILLILFAPWSVYLPIAIARLKFWQRKRWSKQARSNQLGLFAFFWLASIFLFFSVAVTKLPSYILPLIPAGSILVTLLWSEEFSNNQPRKKTGLNISIIFNIILSIGLTIGFMTTKYWLGDDPAIVNFRQFINESGLPGRASIIWLITTILIVFFWLNKNKKPWVIIANLMGFTAFFMWLLIPTLFLMDQGRQLPLRELSATIKQVKEPKEEVIMLGFKKPSVTFYTQERVKFFDDNNEAIAHIKENQDSANTVLILTRPQDAKEIKALSPEYKILDTSGVYQLWRLDKNNFK